MNRRFDPLVTAINAVENVTAVPVTRADILRVLRQGEGAGVHVRAVFIELHVDKIVQIAIEAGISDAELHAAWRKATARHADIVNEGVDGYFSGTMPDGSPAA
jgi:hypothetical protein